MTSEPTPQPGIEDLIVEYENRFDELYNRIELLETQINEMTSKVTPYYDY